MDMPKPSNEIGHGRQTFVSGHAILVSGTPCAGKSTLISQFLRENTDFRLAKRVTTRRQRKGENYSQEYDFRTLAEYKELQYSRDVLFSEKTFGQHYCHIRSAISRTMIRGFHTILVTNVGVGFRQTPQNFSSYSLVFVTPVQLDRKLRYDEDFLTRLIALRAKNRGDGIPYSQDTIREYCKREISSLEMNSNVEYVYNPDGKQGLRNAFSRFSELMKSSARVPIITGNNSRELPEKTRDTIPTHRIRGE